MTTHDDKEETTRLSRRRRLLKWVAGLAIVSFVASLIAPLKDLRVAAVGLGDMEGTSNLIGQRLVFAHVHAHEPGGHEHEEGAIVTADKLSAPDNALVYPENLSDDDNYLINLHRLEPDQILEPTKLEWTDQGFVAYSAICTHLGCTVGWEDAGIHDLEYAHDHCPCHVGLYNPYKGAEVVGGPPPRPTPQIGVEINEQTELVLTSEFEGPVGP